jgi:hypothetical protein
MELIRRTIPCTFCGSHNHCVAVCWKKKVYGKNIMATRSTPRQDDATLQVKKNPRANSVQPRQESEKSNGDSTQSGQGFIKFIRARNYCSHCQRNGHCEDSCWKLHPELRCSKKPERVEERMLQKRRKRMLQKRRRRMLQKSRRTTAKLHR